MKLSGCLSRLRAYLSPKLRVLIRLSAYAACIKFILLAAYGIYYVLQYTPVPAYALDRMHLRRNFLPNFTCTACTNFNFSYVPEATSQCSNNDEPVFLLILVLTYHSNAEARKVIRETWGGVKHYRNVTVKTQFVFGLHHDHNLNDQPQHEAAKYNDVLQVGVYDGYRMLTEKVMSALWWVSARCPQARYVLKTDDDSFNHPYRFVDYLLDHIHIDPFIGGYCFTVYPDYREGSKHHVSEALYPRQYYPTYCSGPGYILSHTAITRILTSYHNVRYLPMEDVYITGMIREVCDMGYTQIPSVVAGWDTLTPCDLATHTKNTHNIWPTHMRDIWTAVIQGEQHPTQVCVQRGVYRAGVLCAVCAVWGVFVYWMLVHLACLPCRCTT